MRNLVLLLGAPGAGKSTWVKENQLEEYTLSSDQIRLMMETPRVNPKGELYISQRNDKRVWQILFEILEERMKRGEFVIIDATHSRPKLINRYRNFAKKYRYRVSIIDFTDISLVELFERNKHRGYKNVPEDAVKNIYERLQQMKIPGWVDKVIKPKEFENFTNILYDWNEFEYLVFIGDIHGNYDELVALMMKINEAINFKIKKTAFVFLGDYFDRGKYNASTFMYLENLMNSEDIFTIFLTGNHDYKWLPVYEEYLKGEFSKRKPPYPTLETFKQFKKAEITVDQVKKFYWRLGQLVHVKFGDMIITATHGGIPVPPSIFQPTEDFIFGVGQYEDSETVDKTWNKTTPNNWYSIHGHRNIFGVSIRNTDRTFNLNGDAEFIDGELRALVVKKSGEFIPVTQKSINGVPRPKRQIRKVKDIPEGEILSTMSQHKFVNVKEFEGNIFSINFTNQAFRKQKWDELTIRARGLFICLDENGKEIVCVRGYNKFFNLNEREETKLRNLTNPELYPAEVYLKYNGFLGLLSVDPRNNEWLITTKGSMEGQYVEMFKEVITPYLSEELKQVIRTSNVTLIFEVIHKNDPHIVDYHGDNFVVLLDVIKNRYDEEEKLGYNTLRLFGKSWGFRVKEQVTILNSYQDLYYFIQHNYRSVNIFTNDGIEGYVIEFQGGFKVKVKTDWYKFWKIWRGKKDYIARIQNDHSRLVQFSQSLHTFEDQKFFGWLKRYEGDLRETNIITLRKQFLEEEQL